MQYELVGQHAAQTGKIIRDVRILLVGVKTSKAYLEELRLVEALVTVDGKERAMSFITNNFEWSPNSIADLYESRWGVADIPQPEFQSRHRRRMIR